MELIFLSLICYKLFRDIILLATLIIRAWNTRIAYAKFYNSLSDFAFVKEDFAL